MHAIVLIFDSGYPAYRRRSRYHPVCYLIQPARADFPSSTACTSCAIEVGYHTSPSIKAEIVFLTTAEWRQELSSLLAQIQSENVYPGTPINLDGENGVAWAKVRPMWPISFVINGVSFRNSEELRIDGDDCICV